jgi:hypothetical protein
MEGGFVRSLSGRAEDDEDFSTPAYENKNGLQVSWSRGYYKKFKSSWWRITVFIVLGQVFRIETSPTEEYAERRTKQLEEDLRIGKDLYLYNERLLYAYEMPSDTPVDETLHKRKKKAK